MNYGSVQPPESGLSNCFLERLLKSIVKAGCQRFTRHFNPSRNSETPFPPADPLPAPCFLSCSFPEALVLPDVNRFLKTPHLANRRGCRETGGCSCGCCNKF